MRFSTDALVIREKNIGENDRIITLLSYEYGVINAYASGVKSIKSKRAAATALLAFSSFEILKKGENYRIEEASVKKMFFGAGSDVAALSLSQYFCELSYYLGPNDSDSYEFLRLILNSINFISAGKRSLQFIKAVTELRMAAISGYTPNLVACDNCGKFEDETMYFDFVSGVLYCDACKKGNNCFIIDNSVLKAMRHIVYSDFERLYSFELSENSLERLNSITEKYISCQSERSYPTLEFYKSFL